MCVLSQVELRYFLYYSSSTTPWARRNGRSVSQATKAVGFSSSATDKT